MASKSDVARQPVTRSLSEMGRLESVPRVESVASDVFRAAERSMRRLVQAASIIAALQLFTSIPAFGFPFDPSLDPDPPFVICHNQPYALCAEASCFVYNGVAYCKCNSLKDDSISLQLSYSTLAGERNVCDVIRQGIPNGYKVSTFSFPNDVRKGGPAAVYTCPGSGDAGNGVSAPVAYGQCDGGICFKSTKGQTFPGFGQLNADEIICSCPISTDATPGSSDSLGYQIFGPYHPNATIGSRCDASACSACSVPNPTANGTILVVGAPTGSPSFLTLRLDGPPVPDMNQCLCTCTEANSSTTCTVGSDTTP